VIAGQHSLTQRLAYALARHAVKVLPRHRSDWAEAMRNELDYLPREQSALRWMLGCLLVSYHERIRIMISDRPPISRPVLGLEMLVCLVPVTWFFIVVVAQTASGRLPLHAGTLYALGCLAGPLTLVAAIRMVIFRRRLMTRTSSALLIAVAVWTMCAYTGQLIHSGLRVADVWRDFVLIALLPLVAAAHLIWISSSERPQTSIV
jgi:hypothetical protein